jgi:hypothetical protein
MRQMVSIFKKDAWTSDYERWYPFLSAHYAFWFANQDERLSAKQGKFELVLSG